MIDPMKALWLEDRQLRLRTDVSAPSPAPNEALVEVLLAGICATDLELTRGYLPFTGVPGHELVGEIAQAPAAPDRVGQRVVAEINLVCGECPACHADRPTHCERRKVLGIRGHDGAFAEYLTLPLANLHPVPDDLPDEAAVFCEPLAAALHILVQRPIGVHERVLLVGAGRLGQLIARALATTGCDLTVVARHLHQRELLETAGIRWCSEEAVASGGFDLAVEASGHPDGFALARRAVRAGGTLVLKSTYGASVELDLSSLVVDEITLIGSRCGDFVPALERLSSGAVMPQALIEARYPLDRGLEAFAHAARPGTMKVLIDPRA
jgi:2-desacetyl-2-hydroxyethyl bacteriochlorophyllide A dehydrogenase